MLSRRRRFPLQFTYGCFRSLNTTLSIFNRTRCRRLAECYTCTRGIQQADRFIRKLTTRNIAMR